MGVFTPQLWEVLKYEHDSGDGMRIGLDDYPIHDPAHRQVLNQLIIDEYYEREIGLETIPLFCRRLRLKMRQMMPYFNKMYASEELVYDALTTVDLMTNREDQSSEESKSSADIASKVKSVSGARNVNSDTPQTMLSADEDYATSATDANSNATSDNASNQTGTAENTANNSGKVTVTGRQGGGAALVQAYRATLLNIDMMILPELNELFMLVRGNGVEILPEPFDRLGNPYVLPHLGAF